MTEMIDFLRNALPWIAIGLFAACSCVTIKAKKDGEEMSRFFKSLSWSPAFCSLFAAIMEFCSGNTYSGTTWLVLCAFNAVVNFSNTGVK